MGYLNMYLVLDKPDPNEAGLSVVSMDALHARSPRVHDLILGNSASVWEEEGFAPSQRAHQQILRTHAVHDRFVIQDFKLEDVSCTPRLMRGDLLILRGDVPHRTQSPLRNHRTSLSLRVA